MQFQSVLPQNSKYINTKPDRKKSNMTQSKIQVPLWNLVQARKGAARETAHRDEDNLRDSIIWWEF